MYRTAIICVYAISLAGFAQIEVKNLSLVDPTEKLLCAGLENLIEVDHPDNVLDISLQLNNYQLTPIDIYNGGSKYLVNVSTAGSDTLNVFSQGSLISSHVFESRVLNFPMASVGEQTSSVISIAEILKDPTFKIRADGCPYDLKAEVTSFEMTVIHRGDSIQWSHFKPIGYIDTVNTIDPETADLDTVIHILDSAETIHEIKGNELIASQLNLIQKLEQGDQVIFSRIKARGIFCPVILKDLSLTIE